MPKQQRKTSRETTLADLNKDFLQKVYQKQLKKCPTLKGCYISTKVARKDGYVRISIRSKKAGGPKENRKELWFYLHQISWFVNRGQIPDGVNFHVSHLCGNRACFKPSHLVVESAQENNARKNCLVSVSCPRKCCVGKKPIMVCAHTPQCRKPQ